MNGDLVFASGAVAAGACVQLPGNAACQAVTNAKGHWQILVTVTDWPNGATFVYVYLGVEKGRQTSGRLVGGDLMYIGRYVLAP